MKTGTVLKNLWAGHETYFICMNFPAYSYKNEAKKTGGISLVCVDGKWELSKAEYYSNHLKDSEHYPVIGHIDLCQLLISEIKRMEQES